MTLAAEYTFSGCFDWRPVCPSLACTPYTEVRPEVQDEVGRLHPPEVLPYIPPGTYKGGVRKTLVKVRQHWWGGSCTSLYRHRVAVFSCAKQ
jgi:hypothetical protein